MSANEHDKQRLGVRSISKAIDTLWGTSADQLSQQELEWFAGFTDAARNDAEDLARIVSGIGFLIDNDSDAGNFKDKREVMRLLTTISNQIDTIAGMITLGDYASSRLMHPDIYNAHLKQKPEETAK
ncbi:hypothetical protein ACH5Y9_03410 [Methylomonas sp. BW4-1]|jgi:hypothetical protein|uniref:hypothetical protein n=1 Tax=Methylomonas sp. BW4-1 TaxID=3376685 RepID=UPI004041C06E